MVYVRGAHPTPDGEEVFAVHRSEDLPIIQSIIRAHQPAVAVELGTAQGGFAAMMADTVAEWGAKAHTFDHVSMMEPRHLAAFPNLTFYEEDVLPPGGNPRIIELISQPDALLYCDNGNKKMEITLYAPHLQVGSLLGVHDYNEEFSASWAEEFVASLGFVPVGHERMEALWNPPNYPDPMTRFWLRKQLTPVPPFRVPPWGSRPPLDD